MPKLRAQTNQDAALSASITALQAVDTLYGGLAFHSTYYGASGLWAAKTVSVAADRYKILSPDSGGIVVGGMKLFWSSQVTLDLSAAGDWDTTAGTDGTVAANRAGKNHYVYACQPTSGTTPVFKFSFASTFPAGYDANTSRKVAGFHCLCVAVDHATTLTAWAADTVIALGETRKPTVWLASNKIIRCSARVGDFKTDPAVEPDVNGAAVGATITDDQITWTVAVHSLEGYVAGDVLPYSAWDLKRKPAFCSPDGMVRIPNRNTWGDIYLQSGTGGTTASVYNAAITHNRTGQQHREDFATVGKRFPRRQEYVEAAFGTTWMGKGGGDPANTGGASDPYGRRMVSDCGIEDAAGHHYVWLAEVSAVAPNLWVGGGNYATAGASGPYIVGSSAEASAAGIGASGRGFCDGIYL